MESVVIIGSGLGGLECGYILAKHGLKVTVLEQDVKIGGCLQTFVRGRAVFDTGFHYVGGLGEGEALGTLFRYFGLMDLPWHQLDTECFDEVIIGDRHFPVASGHERFSERLTEFFPHEKEAIHKYAAFLKNVGEHIFDSFTAQNGDFSGTLFARSAYDYLNETISDPLLRKVLSGTSLKMELNAESLPLYVFAQINNSFICSAWRLCGGGSQIADSLAESIRKMGGEVRTQSRVTGLQEEGGRIKRVVVNDDEVLEADWVISDIHPAAALGLVEETKSLRNIYRKRISSLKNTFGMFTANIALKPETLPYLNRNMFIHKEAADLWHPVPGRTDSVLVNWAVPRGGSGRRLAGSWGESASVLAGSRGESASVLAGSRGESASVLAASRGESASVLAASLAESGSRLAGSRDGFDDGYESAPEYAVSLDLLTPMWWNEVERWAHLPFGHRGDSYVQFKQERAEICISLVERHIPGFRDAIVRVWTSTPLTYGSYLGQPEGSAFGVMKNWSSPMTTVLAPRTPLPNMLLTGQNLNLHGILGVSMTSVFTCAEIVGMDTLVKEILSR